ncbi:MAG TPA: CHASE3 domain-containing protein, partial [Candidatus Acidoferrales bacterium]|nr:CHASE3 domain-containing protein [Candidatus Acidoferrales bacterium]
MGFVVAATILLFAGWESYRNTARFTGAAEARAYSYQLMLALDQVEQSLVDAETGQRGYLLTGDEAYLAPYRAAIKNLDQSMVRLKDSTSNNPDQQKRVEALEPLVEKKLDELQTTIGLRRKHNISAANEILLA